MNLTQPLNVRWLGRMEFAPALELQEQLVAKKRKDRLFEDQLLLLEHEPVYTIGRTPDRSSLFAEVGIDRNKLGAHLPHPLFSINRGGQATYHGPGQLIGYPVIDLRQCGQDLHKYLRWLEQLLIDLLVRYRCAAARIAYWSLGRESQDRFDRCWRPALDHHARVRVKRGRRSLAF